MSVTVASSAFASPLRRVVVTGMGCATPLGLDLPSTWAALLSASSSTDNGIGITTLEQSLIHQNLPTDVLDREMALAKTLPCQVAAPVRDLDYDARTARFVQLALMAGREAAQNANLLSWLGHDSNGGINDDNVDDTIRQRRERVGTCIGSGMSSVREVANAAQTTYGRNTIRRLSPHFVPKVLSNSAAGRLSLSLSLMGPNHSASTACAAGAHALGDAMRCIQYGDADIMLAGGAEACIDPLSMGGFCRLKALSTGFNDDPMLSSRPFDKKRDGFVMGEGAAVLVLEELEHAIGRGADILCEIKGYGLTGDAHHVTAPDPDGRGAERAMAMALERAGLRPGDVDYVNAHSTSTPLGDEIEARSIDRTLITGDGTGGRANDLFVSSTKGATGHLLGAAGAIEAVFTAKSMADGTIPPTANLDQVCDQDVGFKYVTGEPLHHEVKVAMSNSFGFGGTNAAVIFANFNGYQSGT
mmetsp:Transcript_2909/g.6736  ORF Transcript_2909/g.6736 Transcript_2909/m.6736 type:complete len:472 (-) Transcript_2909:29-1444(-)